jgi:hypothetical protein
VIIINSPQRRLPLPALEPEVTHSKTYALMRDH